MSQPVKPGDGVPKESASTQVEHLTDVYRRREIVAKIVRRYDEESIWDNLKSRDVDPQLVDFVLEQISKGRDYTEIRKDLGILRSTDKSWQKIMAAIKQGFRYDGTAFLVQKANEYQRVAGKLLKQIEEALDKGTQVVTKDGDVVRITGPTKELSMAVDTYNRLTQGFIKNGKDLGAFVDHEQGGKGGGVTIQIVSAVNLPSLKEVKAHQEAKAEENKRLLEEGKDIPIEAQFAPAKP